MISEEYRSEGEGLLRVVRAGSFHGQTLVKRPADITGADAGAWWQAWLRGGLPTRGVGDPLHVVDLFCASGGLSLGAAVAASSCGLSFRPLAAMDTDAEALAVYARNHKPLVALHESVAAVVDFRRAGTGEDLRFVEPGRLLDERLAPFVDRTDLLIAGPPCQGHSNLNNHTRRDDPRNDLYLAATATALALRARTVVIENVRDVLAAKTRVVDAAIHLFRAAGYGVSSGVLTATDVGAPQARQRHFLIAARDGVVPIDPTAIPDWLGHPPMTLRDAIFDLVARDESHFMDKPAILSDLNRKRVDYLHDHDLHELPASERPKCHQDGHSYPSVYGRMSWDKPAQTITTGFMSPGRGRYVHPSLRRALTPREAARLQGFPDGYDFRLAGLPPAGKALTKWIGDAVPVWLGQAVVLSALEALSRIRRVSAGSGTIPEPAQV